MSGQQVDVLWFEHMGVFSEPIFNFSLVRLTLKQVGTLFGGLLCAYALAADVDQIAGAAAACLSLLMTFYRPRVMSVEQYMVVAMRFVVAKNQRVAEKERVAALMAGVVLEAGQENRDSRQVKDSANVSTNYVKRMQDSFSFLARKKEKF